MGYEKRGSATSRNGGFTMIELLIVMAIVTILGLIAIPRMLGAKEKGRRAACDHNLTALSGEILNEMDSRPSDPNAAEKALDVVVPRHSAERGDKNPRNQKLDGYVDANACGASVPPPSSTCQVFLCFSGSNAVLVQQFEQESARTFRLVVR